MATPLIMTLRSDERSGTMAATLVGTEKQRQWANDIRARYIAEFEQIRSSIEARADRAVAAGQISREDADAAIEAEVGAAIDNALWERDAAWWIDHQHMTALQILRAVS